MICSFLKSKMVAWIIFNEKTVGRLFNKEIKD
jgi:hypothetical protein